MLATLQKGTLTLTHLLTTLTVSMLKAVTLTATTHLQATHTAPSLEVEQPLTHHFPQGNPTSTLHKKLFM